MKYKLKLDYTADELEELKKIGSTYNSPMAAINMITNMENDNDALRNLETKYLDIDYEDEFNFMADINNVVMGTAIFPEKKYIVYDKVTDQYIYYNTLQGDLRWWHLGAETAETNTKDEWLAINQAYEPMLERVED